MTRVYLAEMLHEALVGPWFSDILKRKKSVEEFDHSDLLPVYESSFAKMQISQEILNRLQSDSIRMN